MSENFFWCSDPSEAKNLAQFFILNISLEYISHSELQSERVGVDGNWAPDLEQNIIREIRSRVRETKGNVPVGLDSAPIMVARTAERVVGLAMVSFFPTANIPHVIVEDLVVGAGERGNGIGQRMLDWIMVEARRVGCARAFLESGCHNAAAHEFFERQGFEICSLVFMKPLAPSPDASAKIVLDTIPPG